MVRIVGVDIPDTKRADIALTYIYGVGRVNVGTILKSAQIDPSKRAHEFTDEDVSRISKALESFVVEGDLRQQTMSNIKRMREIQSYRGTRHVKKLPSRGQRTKSNARTRRGKRLTIGAMKKDDRAKVDQQQKTAGK